MAVRETSVQGRQSSMVPSPMGPCSLCLLAHVHPGPGNPSAGLHLVQPALSAMLTDTSSQPSCAFQQHVHRMAGACSSTPSQRHSCRQGGGLPSLDHVPACPPHPATEGSI